MKTSRIVWVGALTLLGLGTGCGGSDEPSCVPGSTAACLCSGGATGVQVCSSSGAYDPCACTSVDGGPGPVDGAPAVDGGSDVDGGGMGGCPAPLLTCGDRCVDTSTDEENCGGCADATHTCADGSFCVDGVCRDLASCPPPFVTCGAECVDPRTNPAHCGASGDCSGARAGAVCGGVCSDGECVFESCSDVLARGASTGDGTYLVDLDGTGPVPPRAVYCDMTTAGGGWTLVYKVRNDVPDIADPWYPMIALGSDDAVPAMPTPLPSGTHFEGPTREVRAAFYYRHGGAMAREIRATVIQPSGTVVIDVRMVQTNYLVMIAGGQPGAPTVGCASSGTYNSVIATSPGLPAVGAEIIDCYNSSAGRDYMSVGTTGAGAPIVGDASITDFGAMFANTTALFWVRSFM